MDSKLPFEQIEFLYDVAIQTATKTLFEDNYEKHGWTQAEFNDVLIAVTQSMLESKLHKWVN